MLEESPKILTEFSLVPESKAKLQAFMDANFELLHKDDPVAKRELQDLIRGTDLIEGIFPKESLKTLGEVFRGESEYAVLIHNCPERDMFQGGISKSEDTYSYYIGNALYEMNNLRHVRAAHLSRKRERSLEHRYYDGIGEIHRDALLAKSGNRVGEYIILSSPYNGENALTEVIHLRRAIESLSEEQRKKVKVRISERAIYEEPIICNLNYVLYEALKAPPDSDGFVKKIAIDHSPRDAETPEITAFQNALEHYSKKINLQPGDLLVVDEHTMFHRAHHGDPVSISALPEKSTSRFLVHHGGGRA